MGVDKIVTLFLVLICHTLPVCEAKILASCQDSSPPCVSHSVEPQTVCQGGNAGIAITFELPASMAENINPRNIKVMHLDQIIIHGTQLKGFLSDDENREEWMSTLSYHKNDVTFQISKSNISRKDEFYSQFTLQIHHIVWETSPSIWFVVENCQSNIEHVEPTPVVTEQTIIDAASNPAEMHTFAYSTLSDANDEDQNPVDINKGIIHRKDKLKNYALQMASKMYASNDNLKPVVMMEALIGISVLTLVTLLSVSCLIYYNYLKKQ